MHPSDEKTFLGCLPERLLACFDGKRGVDIHRRSGIDMRGLNSRDMDDITPNQDRGGATANSVTSVAWSMTG